MVIDSNCVANIGTTSIRWYPSVKTAGGADRLSA